MEVMKMDFLQHQAQGSTVRNLLVASQSRKYFFGSISPKIHDQATIHHQVLRLSQQKCSVEAIIILSILSVKWKGK